MASPFLEAEQERLLQLIHQLRNLGPVAPAYCWLTETSSTKGLKTYTYILLVTQRPDSRPRSQSLGRPGSSKHQHWRDAIARREAIVELEQQLTLIQALIERQADAQVELRMGDLIRADHLT
ncbi:hypothetical protein BST81_24375 [Leptolyngbya sp. 'hensonii']|uniref:hypothetical protein n=1 Tax=Leptolyngbya sp. 'hensonii' TaxID=1922337 RepID=UPI00094FF13A|nr:hypothetical protein [Leptolyngbya sp. 'hensonii']OLP15760.1 hypothetical protein BST81_24375 [Leptolyngbya sp. 'hensonii']